MNYYIEIKEFLNYAGDGLRHYVTGREVVDANHIQLCGVTKETAEITEIIFGSLKTSELLESYMIKVKIIKTVDNNKSINVYCQCPAGEFGRCKHCMAALIYLLR